MSKRTISKSEWNKKLAEAKISKEDLNKLMMNFLVIEGYKDAAEKFQQESGTDPGIELSSISDRMDIRSALQQGNVDAAIEKVNDLDPDQQKLIELIRNGHINEAVDFAQEQLGPQGEANPRFLEELERTMALLAFEVSEQEKSPVGELLGMAQRQKVASELNAAILTSQSQEKDPKLPTLLKVMLLAQTQLEERVKFPKIVNLSTAELEDV